MQAVATRLYTDIDVLLWRRNLRSYRADLDMSQEDLAHLAHLDREVVHHAEHPEQGHAIRFESALRILDVLNAYRAAIGWSPVCTDQVNWRIYQLTGPTLDLSSYCIGLCGSVRATPCNLLRFLQSSRTTPRDVAQVAGLGVRTVYKAARDPVLPETRERLCSAINALRTERGLPRVAKEDMPISIITGRGGRDE
jgi:DNA-binding XRE family transcriptional regulator